MKQKTEMQVIEEAIHTITQELKTGKFAKYELEFIGGFAHKLAKSTDDILARMDK